MMPRVGPREWTPSSWRDMEALQQPRYDEEEEVDSIMESLKNSDGVVDPSDIDELRRNLAEVYESDWKVFLHAGDCAETFASCTRDRVERDFHFLSDMSVELGSPGMVIGRICGQFAKPRSYDSEPHPHEPEAPIPVYRGDLINGLHYHSRQPDPHRMKTAHSICKELVSSIPREAGSIQPHSVYTSHECLLLPYESALVRTTVNGCNYATSAHFLWIGDRTRKLNGAHVEFCRGIENPIGIKVGPSADPDEIANIIRMLNPDNKHGKITVITRFGASSDIRSKMTALLMSTRGMSVLWQCDPMHGNTVLTSQFKTRHLHDIKSELKDTIAAHYLNHSRLHGIHLEATGAHVTECIDGIVVTSDNISTKYHSACDPRLNPDQTREILRFVFELVSGNKIDRLSTNTTTPRSDDTDSANSSDISDDLHTE